jgi:glutaredoxin
MSEDGPAGPRPAGPQVTLLSRRGCHLCELARADLDRLAGRLGFGWRERFLDGDRELEARFGAYVPVLLVDGQVVDFYRVDAARLAAALASAGRTEGPSAGFVQTFTRWLGSRR